jgi:hypothetical protein
MNALTIRLMVGFLLLSWRSLCGDSEPDAEQCQFAGRLDIRSARSPGAIVPPARSMAKSQRASSGLALTLQRSAPARFRRRPGEQASLVSAPFSER